MNRLNFQQWMDSINEICLRQFGMSIHDLPDMPFFDYYSDDYTPEQFMEEVIPDLDALGHLILS